MVYRVKKSAALLIIASHILVFSVSTAHAIIPKPVEIQSVTVKNAEQPSVLDLWFQLLRKMKATINERIENKERFARNVRQYQRGFDLSRIFGRWNGLAGEYAGSREGLGQSGETFQNKLQEFSVNLWNSLMGFPQLRELRQAVRPVIREWVAAFKGGLPKTSHERGDNNPLGNHLNFYESMEQEDPYNTGFLFKIEPLKAGTNEHVIKERTQDTVNAGVKKRFIVKRKEKKFVNNMLVFHKLILNNICVRKFKKKEDISIYHGMLAAMKESGVNENLLTLVQLHIYLMNYHIAKNHQNNGLIIDIDHPQLSVPHGFNPENFIKGLVQLVKNWEYDTYYMLKAFENRFKSPSYTGSLIKTSQRR